MPVPPLTRPEKRRAPDNSLCCPLLSDCVCHRLDNCGNCPSTRPERRRAKSECWQSRRVEFSYFALCLCGCVLPVGFSAYPTIRTKKRASGVGHRPFAQKNVLQSSGKSRRTGKGMKPLKKLEKISHTYFASIPTLGRIPLRAVQSVMDAVQQSCTDKSGIRTTEEQAK